ncbi:MAG TPA: hypothetical protein PKC49_12915, partial [Phycisphaerae bacterium]|nr:hypothetical protein [Phycisphaerae bacterium]
MIAAWVEVFGRLHPMVLHLPIGLIVGLAGLELIEARRRNPGPRFAAGVLAWLAAGSAALSAWTGWVLSFEPGYGGWTLGVHMWLGLAVALLSVAAAAVHTFVRAGRPRALLAYRGLLTATVLALVPGGHLGASLTHGDDFLFAPLRAPVAGRADTGASHPAAPATPPDGYAAVAGIFADYCCDCHGAARQRARLALHTPDAILAGGRSGPAIVPGDPQTSELLRRMRLPIDDDDHMPPADNPQPSAEQIREIERWIAGGARASLAGADGGGSGRPPGRPPAPGNDVAPPPQPLADPPPTAQTALPPREALVALRDRLVHVQGVDADGRLLWVDFAAAGSLPAEEIVGLLTPLQPHLVDVSLARCAVGREALGVLAGAAHLRRLDLRESAVSDADLAVLRDHPTLEELVLVRTQLSDAAAGSLASLGRLRRLYAWDSGLSAEALARL